MPPTGRDGDSRKRAKNEGAARRKRGLVSTETRAAVLTKSAEFSPQDSSSL